IANRLSLLIIDPHAITCRWRLSGAYLGYRQGVAWARTYARQFNVMPRTYPRMTLFEATGRGETARPCLDVATEVIGQPFGQMGGIDARGVFLQRPFCQPPRCGCCRAPVSTRPPTMSSRYDDLRRMREAKFANQQAKAEATEPVTKNPVTKTDSVTKTSVTKR